MIYYCEDTKEKVDNYTDYLYTEHWSNFKESYFKKYDFKCYKCGKTDKIHLHHLTYKRIGKETFEDVMPLCNECHKKEHIYINIEKDIKKSASKYKNMDIDELKNYFKPKRVDFKIKIEQSHILILNQCEMLLREDFNLHHTLISKIYININKVLDKEDLDMDDFDIMEYIDCILSNILRGSEIYKDIEYMKYSNEFLLKRGYIPIFNIF